MILQALIFDVDGTLAETERDAHLVAFNQAFKQAGLDWNWSDKLYESLLAVTGGKERICYYLDQFNTDFLKLNSFESTLALEEFIASLHIAKTKLYKQLMNEGKVPLRPGVKRLIQQAREQGIKLAIATTTTPANVTALLENTLGLKSEQWFEVIAAGDVVAAKKPAADIYFYALEKLNLSASQCLAIEDSENGLISAQQAGLKTVITINDYTLSHNFSSAELVLSDLGEPDQAFNVIACKNTDKQQIQQQFSCFSLELAELILAKN